MGSREHSEGHGYGGESGSPVCCGRPVDRAMKVDGPMRNLMVAETASLVEYVKLDCSLKFNCFLGSVLTSLTVERRHGDKGLCHGELGFSPKLRHRLRGLFGLDSDPLGLGNVILARLPLPLGVGNNDGRRSGKSEDRMLLEVDDRNGGNDSNVCDL